jgi:ribose transport system permease protein
MKAYAKAGAGRLLDLGLLPLALVVLFVGLALTEPRFLGPQNLINVLRGGALLMIVACGQMLVLIVRGMDLSVGSTMALTSVVSALVMAHLAPGSGPGVAITAGVAAGLAVGVVVGLCNGIAVAVFGITPFMVTLAMASIVGGVALSLTNGIPIYGLPEAFVAGLGRTLWLGMPPTVWAAAIVVLLVWIVQKYTALGTRIYAVGGSPQASRVSGIDVRFHLVLAYVGCALAASLASLLLTAQIGSGQGSVGDTLALQSIGAAVIAGVSLHGGVGRVQWVALGSLFLLLLNNAMDLLRVDSKAQAIVMGLLIVLVVALDEFKKRRKIDGH